MVAVGVVAVALGGIWFQMLAVFVTSVLIWEVARMIRPTEPVRAMLLAALTGSVLSGLLASGSVWHMWLLAVPALAGTLSMPRERQTFFLYALAIVAAGWGLVTFREGHGPVWLFWLILVVVATDVLGYFAGRALGGPKFWPRVSPRKTWAGTIAGWLGGAAVGAAFLPLTGAGTTLILVSAVLSFASQLGDIAESALKRRMGVKDSSALIPGHGGLFDRFDGLLGAALFLSLATWVIDVPGMQVF